MPLVAALFGGALGLTTTVMSNALLRLPLCTTKAFFFFFSFVDSEDSGARPWEHVLSATVGAAGASAYATYSAAAREKHRGAVADYERRQQEYADTIGSQQKQQHH